MFLSKRFLIFACCVVAFLTAWTTPPSTNHSNPVALSIGLFNQETPKEVEEYSSYYHLSDVSHSDSEYHFSAADGSQFTFRFGNNGYKQVVLTTKLSKKEIIKMLMDYQFVKVKDVPAAYRGMNLYEKKENTFSSFRTICVISNSSPLTISFIKLRK